VIVVDSLKDIEFYSLDIGAPLSSFP